MSILVKSVLVKSRWKEEMQKILEKKSISYMQKSPDANALGVLGIRIQLD